MVTQPVVHGGQVHQIAKALGRPVDSFIDFSASINPFGPPSSVLNAMQQALPACGHYPDPTAEDLRTRLAKEHGVSSDSIVLGNGSSELIRILPRALSLCQGYVAGPTFMEYEASLHIAGARCTYVLATSGEKYAPPLGQLSLLVDGIQKHTFRNEESFTAVFICNPNSPTGRVVSARSLRTLYRQIEQAGLWMVVDEAFIDFCPSHSLIKEISNARRLLILRSFTKFYGMPGIRLGYLVGAPETVTIIRRLLPPWSVSHFAQEAGVAALDDVKYRLRSVKFMQQERQRFMTRLRGVPGLRIIPASANFVMVELPSKCVTADLVSGLTRQGILVRDCQTFSGMTQPALRLAIRYPRDNNRVIHALKETLRDS
ncbi:threonine-phosphate decarboxylase CobD [Candidatus Nitrospira allomarina]|uniref:threonine-phosphate decarboxylase n=1 Tax=Candidatus Nitrospira allomarina TaxID=3020900 RepID=A0AA96JUJ2_9BACT|nr:threonine-phosphate decarboxylase CobD [Candidatus Nitrospira allomarina]WNM60135.1 threonine-phosphate decarboxylase CobD [Candidatus Nitrospira allomarina]